MRTYLIFLALLCLTGTALAEKEPAAIDLTPVHQSCDLTIVTHDWDFAFGDQGFTAATCHVGSTPVWEHGATTYISGTTGPVWGTVLEGDYHSNAGDQLTSPAFEVTGDGYLLEIRHYIHTEGLYDGMRVLANGVPLEPQSGYPEIINADPNYFAWCVDGQAGWTGNGEQGAVGWQVDCFDLSRHIGDEISVTLEFGADGSVAYAGWYVAYIRVGCDFPTPVEDSTWGAIKHRFF